MKNFKLHVYNDRVHVDISTDELNSEICTIWGVENVANVTPPFKNSGNLPEDEVSILRRKLKTDISLFKLLDENLRIRSLTMGLSDALESVISSNILDLIIDDKDYFERNVKVILEMYAPYIELLPHFKKQHEISLRMW